MDSQTFALDELGARPARDPPPTAATTITVLTSRNRTGKSFSLRDGVLEKTSVATAKGGAIGMPVLSAQDLADLLAKVTVDPSTVLIPGHFLGSDNERPIEIVFEKELAQLLGKEQGDRALAGVHEINGRHVAARLKRSIEPCVWQLLDFDTPEGMPAEFAALDIHGRLARLEEIVPGISTCERIECRSSSARIVEPGGIPGRRSHAWIRISNPELVPTLRLHVQVEAALAGLSFLSPRHSTQTCEIVGRSRLTLFDLAVLIPGRIVFCSAPTIEPAMEKAGWSVTDAGITTVNPGAGALDISHLTMPARQRRDAYREETSEELEISGHGQSFAVISRGLLTLDTPIETAHAPCVATFGDAVRWLQGQTSNKRLRCQTPFRASRSEAAFIGLDTQGEPFLHDVGTTTTYRLGASPAAPQQAVDPRSLEDDGRSIAAVMDILRNEGRWRGVLAYDRFSLHVMLMKPMPRIGPQIPAAHWVPKIMRDVDCTNALAWFHDLGLTKLTPNMLYSAMVAVAQDNAFHPVLDYFDRISAGFKPAEVPSANVHLVDPDLPEADALSLYLTLGFGAEDNKLNRAIARAFMIAMVRRVRQPGCQQDYMLVLISEEQGLHKSRGLRALIGDNWFADRLPAINTKDALIQLHGRVLIERPEVENLTDADKAFLSSSIDRFRAPYGRIAEDYPRTCSFAGTTNQQHLLDDASGGRRIWPVEVTGGDRGWLSANRDLIWRLAVLAEAAGEAAWLDTEDLQKLVRLEQQAIQKPDPWHDEIIDKAQSRARANEDDEKWAGLAVNSAFLHSVFGNLSGEKMSPKDLERATKCLRRAGWRKGRGRSRYRWFPPKFRHEPEAVSNREQ